MSPNVSAIAQSRWDELTPEQRRKSVPVCPDFVLELRSQSDRLKDCIEKMDDWMDNGCQLGWLIDLSNQIANVYRANQAPQQIAGLGLLSGEDVLPNFSLDLSTLL